MATVADELLIQQLPPEAIEALRRLAAEGTLFDAIDFVPYDDFGECRVCGCDGTCREF